MKNFDDTMIDILGFIMMKFMMPLIIVMMSVGVPFVIYVAIKGANSPTFELRKDSWECVQGHTEEHCAKGCHDVYVCDKYVRVR